MINDIIREGNHISHHLPRANPRQGKGNKALTQLCRLLQYYGKYLSSVYQLQLDANPHLYNELTLKMRKADTVWASMAIARKILRFGPSIAMVKTFILNTIELINRQNKESTPIFFLKTLSALWIAMFFLCDHYLWLYRVLFIICRWDRSRTR